MKHAHWRRHLCLALALGLLLALGSTGQAAVTYQTIDFSTQYNATSGPINYNTFLKGAQTFQGVPFQIGNPGFWTSDIGLGTQSLVLNVNIPHVTEVHTLISTYWGEKIAGTFASLEFFGDGGAYFKKDLDGNDDIRDYNFNPNYTTLINGVTTVEVWNNSPQAQHIDKQFIDLPPEFTSQTLIQIVLTDTGSSSFQRTFLNGITAGVAPIPGAAWLFASGLALLAGRRFTRR